MPVELTDRWITASNKRLQRIPAILNPDRRGTPSHKWHRRVTATLNHPEMMVHPMVNHLITLRKWLQGTTTSRRIVTAHKITTAHQALLDRLGRLSISVGHPGPHSIRIARTGNLSFHLHRDPLQGLIQEDQVLQVVQGPQGHQVHRVPRVYKGPRVHQDLKAHQDSQLKPALWRILNFRSSSTLIRIRCRKVFYQHPVRSTSANVSPDSDQQQQHGEDRSIRASMKFDLHCVMWIFEPYIFVHQKQWTTLVNAMLPTYITSFWQFSCKIMNVPSHSAITVACGFEELHGTLIVI